MVLFGTGGQCAQNEKTGNQPDNVELDYDKKVWIRRANITNARGHASSSTVPYGCGFIMAGGAMNNGNHTSDISYYNIETNSWTKIGDLVYEINTPIVRLEERFYCQTGGISTMEKKPFALNFECILNDFLQKMISNMLQNHLLNQI